MYKYSEGIITSLAILPILPVCCVMGASFPLDQTKECWQKIPIYVRWLPLRRQPLGNLPPDATVAAVIGVAHRR